MKIFVLDKYSLATIALALLLILVALPIFIVNSTPASAPASPTLPIYSVETDEKVVAVTFDAAWNADDIDNIIGTLDKYGCKTTFFAVGDWLVKYPDAVKKLSAAGHEIANHSDTHAHLNTLSTEKLITEMEECDKKILDLTGVKNVLFRAPYGEYNDNVITTCYQSGRYPIQWDIDSLDWKNLTTEEMIKRIVPKLKNGSIILLHNGTENTAGALPSILEAIKNEGYSFKTVGELIHKDNFKINHEGRQIKK